MNITKNRQANLLRAGLANWAMLVHLCFGPARTVNIHNQNLLSVGG